MEINGNKGGEGKEDENEKVLELMIENKVLYCEKMKAEREVEVWKAKCTQLQFRIIQLENAFSSNSLSDTPLANTQPLADRDGGKSGTAVAGELENRTRVRKRLPFTIEGSPKKKMAPSTPAGVRPVVLGVIDIDDSDEETDFGLEKNVLPSNNEDDNIAFVSTPGRRRSYNVIMSDVESDDNDDIPISSLRNNRNKEQKREFNTDSGDENEIGSSANGHRLRRLRKCEEKSRSPGNKEDSSENEGDSLNGFIVSNSDGASESDDDDDDAPSSDTEDVNLDYKEIISRIRRTRDDDTVKWDFEADMLAAFSNDPELCLKAVCALYRQQTSEEKFAKGTLVHNGRGFSQCDALRGSKLAEFLIDGDPQSDVKKSVKELQKYDPKGLEVCRQLAFRYSKQLFEIYKSKEDPFFLPS